MVDFASQCFVCGKDVNPETAEKNLQLNLPVCSDCRGTEKEKKAVDDLLEGMAEGFVCGCI